jgi:folate-binding protein YgfZ
LLDILAGYPQITAQTADAFVPQMVNYELLGGVNFKKGCYAGQEIVARLQYLGNLKQRMYLGRIKTETDCPAPGSAIYVADNAQSIGQLVNVQPHPMGGCAALAVLQIAQAEIASSFHVGSATGPVFQLEVQPYELAVA